MKIEPVAPEYALMPIDQPVDRNAPA